MRKDVCTLVDWDYMIGVIYISSSTSLEREWSIVLPSNISYHIARIPLKEVTNKALSEMVNSETIEDATRSLQEADVNIIVFACTAGSLVGGLGWDTKIVSRIEAISGIPATTTATEVINAFKTLDCKNLTICTPYISEVNKLERKFFEEHGLNVLRIEGMEKIRDQEIARINPFDIMSLAERIYNPRSDCVFISCTNISTVEIISKLERKIGKPVVSSNSATLWGVLKKLNYKGKIKRYGVLLEKYLL